MVFGDQLLGQHGVLHPLADAVGDVLRELGVGRLVEEDLEEVLQPDAEPGAVVEPVPQLHALLPAHVPEAPAVGVVFEAGGGAAALGEDVVVAAADVGHLLVGDQAVVERGGPVGPALEHHQLLGLLGDLGDGLDGGGAGADHGHPLARQIHRLGRPIESVEGRAGEGVHALDPGVGRDRQHPQGGEHEAAGHLRAVGEGEAPQRPVPVERHGRDPAAEPDPLPQVELVGHVVQVAEGLGLGGEALHPVPFLQQLPVPGVPVGVALGIEAGAGVAILVPGAAEVGVALQAQGVDAEIHQPLDLVHAGHAGPDHHHLVVHRGSLGRPVDGRSHGVDGHQGLPWFLTRFRIIGSSGW